MGKSYPAARAAATANGTITRFTPSSPCPVCGGWERMKRGQGTRCFGFLSTDGRWVHCSREDHAGRAKFFPRSETYSHKARGECPCGVEHAPPTPGADGNGFGHGVPVIDATYDYQDAAGKLLFQVVRFKNPKSFRQRRPNGVGGWIWNLSGVKHVLYRLPELRAADPAQEVIIPEGEKDVERLWNEGFIATCNPMGAGKWREEYSEGLRGRRVVIIPDNDQKGRDHAEQVARSVHPVAASVKVVPLSDLPEKGDVSDFLSAGGTADQLGQLINRAPFWTPEPKPSANGQGARSHPPAQDDGPDDRADISITPDLHKVVDESAAALASHPNVYERGHLWVEVIRQEQDDPDGQEGVKRKAGAPLIVILNKVTARTIISRLARFWAYDRRDQRWVRKAPPRDVAEAVIGLKRFPECRDLSGIIEAPTLKPDGSLLVEPGYDQDTGLLYLPNAVYPRIPEDPSEHDVKAAAAELLRLVTDFPFKGDPDMAAWLALVLTLVERGAIEGPTPAFLISANVAGSGKSILVSIASQIAVGRPPAYDGYAGDDVEMEKRLSAVAIAGDPLLLLDNAANGSAVGGPALDRAIKADGTFRARILGKTEMGPDVPWRTVIAITGNNLATKDDALRRFIPCFLRSPLERPETRDPAHYAITRETGLSLGQYVMRERPRLVAAALTILRGYISAGRPKAQLTPMDFEAWENVVRRAVHFATAGFDPCGSRASLQANDETTLERHRVVKAWKSLCHKIDRNRGITSREAAEAVQATTDDDLKKDFLEAFPKAVVPKTGEIDTAKLGYALRRHRDAPTPHGVLTQEEMKEHSASVWFVKEV